MIGTTLGNYEIREPLGAGGMGEVYRAHDTNLRRDVAIKVLPEALAAEPERLARMQREAHLLASVNHPNIAAIYNLERAADTRWLVLELVEGTTVEQLLHAGPLPVEEALRIGTQVASALEAAHEQGIVHRDLKSANVMVDDKGRVKVLDFGIAKDLSGARIESPDATDTSLATQAAIDMATHLTGTGVIVGTAPYMSPEQIRGHDVDKRTDNWAFGCLLFELLTGRRPFDRETVADTLAAILEHEPTWDLLPDRTPAAVRSLLQRCLHKDAGSRLHDVADARVELEHIVATGVGTGAVGLGHGGAATRPRMPSGLRAALMTAALIGLVALGAWGIRAGIGGEQTEGAGAGAGAGGLPDPLPANAVAVLRFDNNSLEPDQTRYYATGLATTIASTLQTVPGLIVPAWTSSSRFDNDTTDLKTIGRSLDVSKVLSGSVQFALESVVVSVELTDVVSGLSLWRTQADLARDDLDGVFAFQQRVAEEVAGVLALELSEEAASRIRQTDSLQAYNAYLRGLEAYPRRDAPSLYEALDHFEAAARLDPDFAAAHADVASTHLLLTNYGGVDRREVLADVRARAERALALDSNLGRAHGVLGIVRRYEQRPDWKDEIETALRLNPNDGLIHQFYGWNYFLENGPSEKAWLHTREAARLDPMMPGPRENLGWLALGEGLFEQAVEHTRQAVALDDQYANGHMMLGVALQYSGNVDEAIAELRRARELNPVDFRHTRNLALALVESGGGAEAVTLLNGWNMLHPDDASALRLAAEVHRARGALRQAATLYQASYDAAPGAEALAKLALLDLDRGDAQAAAQKVEHLQDRAAGNRWTPVVRLNLDLYRGRANEGADLAHALAQQRQTVGYLYNWKFFANQFPLEPTGYLSLLAGRPRDSLLLFETTFPDLLGDDPQVHAFSLKPAVDLVVVLRHNGRQAQADALLQRAAAYVASLPEAQRRYGLRELVVDVLALQGRTGEALDAMEQAIEDGYLSGWWRLALKPHLASIRDQPRFRAMVQQLRERATR